MALVSEYTSWPPQGASAGHFSAREDRCAADPRTPPKDWVYGQAAIGFVTRGCFEYSTEGKTVLAAPGSVVLGNAGEHFSVRHLDTLGNNRLVVFLKDDMLDQIADAANLNDARFQTIALPPSQRASRMFSLMHLYAQGACNADEALFTLTESALTARRDHEPRRIAPRDRQRVQAAINHIDARFDEPCSLDTLSSLTGLSRFHFVRMFGAIVGESPTQYLINKRVRTAGERLISTSTPIADLALEVGFNDLSHFYACFKQAFGCTPRQWRMRAS